MRSAFIFLLVLMGTFPHPSSAGEQKLVCSANSENGEAPSGFTVPTAAKLWVAGSCEKRKICVIDTVCTKGKRRFFSSAVCLAKVDGTCPSVSECMQSKGLDFETANIEGEAAAQDSGKEPAGGETAP